MKTKKAIDAAFVQHLDLHYRKKAVTGWKHVEQVVPILIFELLALGPEAMRSVHVYTVHLTLDNGKSYRLGYEHSYHGIVLREWWNAKSLKGMVVFRNGTPQQEIWAALHPAAAAQLSMAG